MIANWMRTWQNEGIEGLSKLRGRPSMSNNNKEEKLREKVNERTTTLKKR